MHDAPFVLQASTNAITQLFVSSTAAGKATLNVCTNTAAASLIDSVTVDAPEAKQSSGCAVWEWRTYHDCSFVFFVL